MKTIHCFLDMLNGYIDIGNSLLTDEVPDQKELFSFTEDNDKQDNFKNVLSWIDDAITLYRDNINNIEYCEYYGKCDGFDCCTLKYDIGIKGGKNETDNDKYDREESRTTDNKSSCRQR